MAVTMVAVRGCVAKASCALPAARPMVRAQQKQAPQQKVAASQPARVSMPPARREERPLLLNGALTALATNVVLALPAHADAGKIFDFNLTLPIIAAEFLFLMFVVDSLWFKPMSKVLDDRDTYIRERVSGVKDNSSEIQRLQDDAAAVLKQARLDAQKIIEDTKKQVEAKLEAEVSSARARIEKELAAALANLAAEKEKSLSSLDTKVSALSEAIVAKLIPAESVEA